MTTQSTNAIILYQHVTQNRSVIYLQAAITTHIADTNS